MTALSVDQLNNFSFDIWQTKFLAMSDEMNKFYKLNSNTLRATTINVVNCYAICHEGDWYRVRVLSKPTIDNMVHCFLFDFGQEINVALNDLHQLKREFAVEQAQVGFSCFWKKNDLIPIFLGVRLSIGRSRWILWGFCEFGILGEFGW